MGGGGRRWEEVGGGGRRWEEVGGGGRRWEEVGGGGRRWEEVGGGEGDVPMIAQPKPTMFVMMSFLWSCASARAEADEVCRRQ